MLARLLGQLAELGDPRRARAHPAGVRGGGPRRRGRPRRASRPASTATCARSPDAAAAARRRDRDPAGRDRHPPRGARRPAQGPARGHRHAARRRRRAAREFALPGALQARARDQRRLALPRRLPPDERVPRRAQGRRRRPARRSRRRPRGSPSSPPRRRRSGATSSRRKRGHVAQRALARRAARRRGGRRGGRRRGRARRRRRGRARRGHEPAPEDVVLSARGRGAAAREAGRGAGGRRRAARSSGWCARAPTSASPGCGGCSGRARCRPRDGRAAEVEIRDYDEDKVLLDSAVKASRRLLHDVLRLAPTRATSRAGPRTAASRPTRSRRSRCSSGSLAAAAFATGERWGLVAGAILLQAAFTTDCVDGQLARYTRTFSKLGAWLDSIFDRSKEYVCFAGLAIGASRGGRPRVGARLRGDHAADRAPLLGLLLRRRRRRA